MNTFFSFNAVNIVAVVVSCCRLSDERIPGLVQSFGQVTDASRSFPSRHVHRNGAKQTKVLLSQLRLVGAFTHLMLRVFNVHNLMNVVS